VPGNGADSPNILLADDDTSIIVAALLFNSLLGLREGFDGDNPDSGRCQRPGNLAVVTSH
jgi:hypothetical protein